MTKRIRHKHFEALRRAIRSSYSSSDRRVTINKRQELPKLHVHAVPGTQYTYIDPFSWIGLDHFDSLKLGQQVKRFEELLPVCAHHSDDMTAFDKPPKLPEPEVPLDCPRVFAKESECMLPSSIGMKCRFYESAQTCFIRQREMTTELAATPLPVVLPVCFSPISMTSLGFYGIKRW